MITQRTMHIALVRACVLLSWLAAIVAADGDESLCERKEKKRACAAWITQSCIAVTHCRLVVQVGRVCRIDTVSFFRCHADVVQGRMSCEEGRAGRAETK